MNKIINAVRMAKNNGELFNYVGIALFNILWVIPVIYFIVMAINY